MRNIKKYMLTIIMLLPMLIMMVHDIIPHHDHQLAHQCVVTNTNTHNHNININDHSDHSKHTISGICVHHQHKSDQDHCCHLQHHRLQQELKFQIFLVGDLIRLDTQQEEIKTKFFVWNTSPFQTPERIVLGLRAPPAILS